MSTPTKETFTLRLDIGQTLTADKAGTIYAEWNRLAAAYRSTLARAKLTERQYRQTWALYDSWFGTKLEAEGASMKARHAHERKELEA